eukprot:scaffold21767_cov18-Tisochrysis_lutea.AAC.2
MEELMNLRAQTNIDMLLGCRHLVLEWTFPVSGSPESACTGSVQGGRCRWDDARVGRVRKTTGLSGWREEAQALTLKLLTSFNKSIGYNLTHPFHKGPCCPRCLRPCSPAG